MTLLPQGPQTDTSGTERSGQNRRTGEAWVWARAGSLSHCTGSFVRSVSFAGGHCPGWGGGAGENSDFFPARAGWKCWCQGEGAPSLRCSWACSSSRTCSPQLPLPMSAALGSGLRCFLLFMPAEHQMGRVWRGGGRPARNSSLCPDDCWLDTLGQSPFACVASCVSPAHRPLGGGSEGSVGTTVGAPSTSHGPIVDFLLHVSLTRAS